MLPLPGGGFSLGPDQAHAERVSLPEDIVQNTQGLVSLSSAVECHKGTEGCPKNLFLCNCRPKWIRKCQTSLKLTCEAYSAAATWSSPKWVSPWCRCRAQTKALTVQLPQTLLPLPLRGGLRLQRCPGHYCHPGCSPTLALSIHCWACHSSSSQSTAWIEGLMRAASTASPWVWCTIWRCGVGTEPSLLRSRFWASGTPPTGQGTVPAAYLPAILPLASACRCGSTWCNVFDEQKFLVFI